MRGRFVESKESLETGIKSFHDSEDLMGEALRLVDLVSELMVRSAEIQENGSVALQAGMGRIMGLSLDVENVYRGSRRYESITAQTNHYVGGYENIYSTGNEALDGTRTILSMLNGVHDAIQAQGQLTHTIQEQGPELVQDAQALRRAMNVRLF